MMLGRIQRSFRSKCFARRFKSSAAETVAETQSASSSSPSFPIGTSLGAVVVGVATVSAAAGVVEALTAPSCPTYTPSGQRYDQGTFLGRFSKMVLQCDPRLVLYTQAQVLQAKEILDNYKEHQGKDRELWEAQRLVQSALNDRGEFIPSPFRMSGFVPYNGPVCVAMLAAQSTPGLLFWSFVNQSQNALVNFFNRNTDSAMSNQTIAVSYAAAVGSALTVGLGLATLIQKRYPAEQAKKMMRWVAFPSTVVASVLNCYIVRSPELDSGIQLMNERGENVAPGETSKVAAAQGVYSTVLSRSILPAPVFFGPPLLMSLGPIRRYLDKKPVMTIPVTTFMLLTSFGIGLPATVAIFPQIATIPAEAVEERFQHLVDPETKQPYKIFYYNKGL